MLISIRPEAEMNPVPLPQLRDLAQEAIERAEEATRQLAAVARDNRGLDLKPILADIATLFDWMQENDLLKPPDSDAISPEELVAGIKRMAELVGKAKKAGDSLTDEEYAELKEVVSVVAEPTERMQIRKQIGEAFQALAAALNLLLAQDERVLGAHATIEALAKKMRS